jgi:putative transcriptional regulator
MTIVCKLDQLLKARNFTIQKVSEDTGIARSVLTEMRDNKRKRYDKTVLDKLCIYFNCPLSDLLDRQP